MVKRYTVNVASIAELYDVLPGEVINAQDYDDMAAKLQGTQDELYSVAKAAEQLGESLELAKAALAESERYEAQNHERIQALEAAARQLLSLVANKGQPMSHPDNQALYNAGDTIMVNEGNLWNLQMVLGRTSEMGQ